MTRSRWVALVVALVVGVLVVHVAAGWYFASAMQQDAFTVRPSVVNKDLRVTAVGGGTISLAETGTEEPSLRQDEVYGLAWEGGFGRISGAPRESSAGAGETGQGTTRSFTVLTGQPPTVGAAAGLQVYAYPPDPVATWGDAVQELSCPGPAGALREVYLPGRGTPGWCWCTARGRTSPRPSAPPTPCTGRGCRRSPSPTAATWGRCPTRPGATATARPSGPTCRRRSTVPAPTGRSRCSSTA
ncbi:hypothetical protein [Arsenicicoccus piscis]|uniref:hypothetical protein n=1 Tax=Arsenicicoccus piscis TaxID=673954 RepID=UPI0024E0E96C|nr:hypothetical protein [Arsenicicoccus piscis]